MDLRQEAAAADAVGNLIAAIDPGTMANRFVLVVETLGNDGAGVWVLTNPGAQPWDVLGLLDFAQYRVFSDEDANDE